MYNLLIGGGQDHIDIMDMILTKQTVPVHTLLFSLHISLKAKSQKPSKSPSCSWRPLFWPFLPLSCLCNWFSHIENKNNFQTKVKNLFASLLVAEISKSKDWEQFVIKNEKDKEIQTCVILTFWAILRRCCLDNIWLQLQCFFFHCSVVAKWYFF